jgi:hypothetical protein
MNATVADLAVDVDRACGYDSARSAEPTGEKPLDTVAILYIMVPVRGQ